MSNISTTHGFDYIVLRVKFGLTSCEELATYAPVSQVYIYLRNPSHKTNICA